MIAVLGYNFCSDGNCIDPVPTYVPEINCIKISNGIFDHLDISSNVTSDASFEIPDGWDFDTIFDCNFNGNINGGNVDDFITNIVKVKIKRRKSGEFGWTTIRVFDISDPNSLSFVFNDNLAMSDEDYEYAYVPTAPGDVEGNYIIDTVQTKYKGVYICDANTIYKFIANVQYDNTDNVQQVGTYTVLGRRYPVVISNGLVNYQTGSMSGTVLPDNYEKTHTFSPTDITKQRNALVAFLTNKKPKMIKDYQGNMWLVYITGNPATQYANDGSGLVDVSLQWTEIGDKDNKGDLYRSGLIPTGD